METYLAVAAGGVKTQRLASHGIQMVAQVEGYV
jgi:hypothetical protein